MHSPQSLLQSYLLKIIKNQTQDKNQPIAYQYYKNKLYKIKLFKKTL